MRNVILCSAVMLGISFNLLHAQVPQVINYQGRMVIGGTNFNGTGQFKFAMVNGAGSVSYWSNDGTSAGGGQPTAAVSLLVTNGLYAVLLGDTGIPNMIVLPATVFTNSDVRLRLWFNDGVTGFQLLTPDQRIAAVGYALIAANVPDGIITSNKLANGAVNGAKIADGTITAAKLGTNAVTSVQVSNVIALGNPSVNGRLDVYHTTAGTPGISLYGDLSQISTYGSDGQEQVRIYGSSWGDLWLMNNQVNNAIAARLNANAGSGGYLGLYDINGDTRAYLNGNNSGGSLHLYRGNSGAGATLEADSANGGALTLYKTNGASGVTLFADQNGGGAVYVGTTNGGDRVVLDGYAGNGGGEIRVQTGDGNYGVRAIGDSGGAGVLYVYNTNSGNRLTLDGLGTYGGGQILGYANDGSSTFNLQGDDGNGAGLVQVRNNVSSTRVALSGQNSSGGGQIDVTGPSNVVSAMLMGDRYGGQFELHDSAGYQTVLLDSSASGGGFGAFYTADGGYGLFLDGDVGGAGVLYVYNTNGSSVITLDGSDADGNGRVTTQVLQITGGSDLSENFNVRADAALKPGMVVSIDPERPGELRVSPGAYDRTVAGIISGAGGISTGMLMGQAGTKADGKHPVALTGRVYCLADASKEAIQAGDLLTTSAVPGHAMKVTDHQKAQGAIIGKAMSALASGKGLVLVLVSLQ